MRSVGRKERRQRGVSPRASGRGPSRCRALWIFCRMSSTRGLDFCDLSQHSNFTLFGSLWISQVNASWSSLDSSFSLPPWIIIWAQSTTSLRRHQFEPHFPSPRPNNRVSGSFHHNCAPLRSALRVSTKMRKLTSYKSWEQGREVSRYFLRRCHLTQRSFFVQDYRFGYQLEAPRWGERASSRCWLYDLARLTAPAKGRSATQIDIATQTLGFREMSRQNLYAPMLEVEPDCSTIWQSVSPTRVFRRYHATAMRVRLIRSDPGLCRMELLSQAAEPQTFH